jgi:hypothetical protein
MLDVFPGQLDDTGCKSPVCPSQPTFHSRGDIHQHCHFFEPESVAAMGAAYRAVLAELDLPDRENAGTLMVAKRVIEMAARGERDPHRLAIDTLELLCR